MLPHDAGKPDPSSHLPEPRHGNGTPEGAPLRGPLAANLGQGWRGGMAASPQAPEAADTMGYLKALRRRWVLALGLGSVLAAAAGAGAWFLLGANRTAFAQVQVASNPQVVAFKTADTPDGRNDFPTYEKTQAARIHSRFVLNAALGRDEVKKLSMVTKEADPVAWLEDELKLDLKDGSEIITVSLTGTEPDELITLVNAVIQSYLQDVDRVERKRRLDRVAELEDVQVKSKEKLRAKRDMYRKLADQVGGSDSQALTQKQVMLLSTYGDLRRQHAQVSFDLMKAQSRLAAIKTRANSPEAVPDSLLREAEEADAEAKELVERVARLKAVIAEYNLSANDPNESGCVRARKMLREASESLAARAKELRAGLEEGVRKKGREQLDADQAQAQDEVTTLTTQEKSLLAEVQRLGQEADKIGNSSTELEMLRNEINQDEDFTKKISDEYGAIQVELRSPPRVSLYQEAGLQKQDMKRQVMAAVLAPLGVFGLVGFCISWWEMRSRKIQTVKEVVAGLGMRVVGAVPDLPNLTGRHLMGSDQERDIHENSFLEAIDAIRTMLLREAAVDGTRVVMVTSAVGGEGKTTLASHLAGSLARAGRKTLLVDCDLRVPAVHQLFEAPLQPGLSEVLLKEIDLEGTIQPTSVKGLAMIAAGEWNRDVLQALAREGGAQAVFAQLKADFDFIVVDSHPVLLATDSLLIGQHVDAVLLSLFRDVSQIDQVYSAGQRLTALGIRLLGAVVNGMHQEEIYKNAFAYPVAGHR